MTDDIIEHAEAALARNDPDFTLAVFVPPLLAALKAARAQRDEFRAQLEYANRLAERANGEGY